MFRTGFTARTIRRLHRVAERSAMAEGAAQSPGLLQRLDPRAKLAGLGGLILAGVWTHHLTALLVLLSVVLLLTALSRLPLRLFTVPAGALLFTLLIALPSLFLVPGDELFRLPVLGDATVQGARSVLFLLLRVAVATTSSSLLVLTTPWPHVLKALRVLGVPVTAIVILSMTSRYLFVLLTIALDLVEARESRRVGRLSGAQNRQLVASSAGVLLAKALGMSEEIYMAMRSRGFRGEVYILTDLQMRGADWIFTGSLLTFAALTAVLL